MYFSVFYFSVYILFCLSFCCLANKRVHKAAVTAAAARLRDFYNIIIIIIIITSSGGDLVNARHIKLRLQLRRDSTAARLPCVECESNQDNKPISVRPGTINIELCYYTIGA